MAHVACNIAKQRIGQQWEMTVCHLSHSLYHVNEQLCTTFLKTALSGFLPLSLQMSFHASVTRQQQYVSEIMLLL